MFYRVTLNLIFDSQDEARDFYYDGKRALPKAIVLNPCEPNQECSTITLQKCYHDEAEGRDCEIVEQEDNCPVCP